jgi:hypothetical protein
MISQNQGAGTRSNSEIKSETTLTINMDKEGGYEYKILSSACQCKEKEGLYPIPNDPIGDRGSAGGKI